MAMTTRRGALGLIGGAAATATLGAPAIAQNRPLVLGALRFTSHSPSFIAATRGYFEEAGLNVELRFFQAAQPMAVAIASGDVDYAMTAISGGLISLADRGAIKVIGGGLREEAGIPGQQILASDAAFQAGLRAPADLGGKNFGMTTAGSSFHYMGSKIAAAEGVSMTFRPLQKVGAIIGALRSGDVDAWTIVPHIASALTGGGAAHQIGSVSDYLPDYQVTTIFTSASNAAEERGMTEDFLSGMARGAADYNDAMLEQTGGQDGVDAMVDLIHQYVYTDRERDAAARSIIAGTMRLAPNGELNIASVQDQLSWFQSEDLVDASITIDTLVDPSYVDIIGA